MRLLLDTHILIWTLVEPARLPPAARDIIEDPANEVLFSIASVWEVAIKAGLERGDFGIRPEQIVDGAGQSGIAALPLGYPAIFHVAGLPHHHRDPFDRLLVAQAIVEPVHLLTADPQLVRYSDLVRLVA